MRHKGRVARIRNQPRQLRRDPQLPLHRAEQQDAAISGNAPAVEGGNHLLAADGWKTKRRDRIVGHGGCGSMRLRGQDGFDTQSLNAFSVLRDTASKPLPCRE